MFPRIHASITIIVNKYPINLSARARARIYDRETCGIARCDRYNTATNTVGRGSLRRDETRRDEARRSAGATSPDKGDRSGLDHRY